MMRFILILILFCNVSFYCQCSSFENKDITDTCEISNVKFNHNYLCYKFGISDFVSVTISDGDTTCIVDISDDVGNYLSTTCIKSPILKWAFEEMAVELCNAKYVINEEYQPAYYRLSLYHDGNEMVFISSSKQVDGNDDLNEKLDALKSFIIKIWIINRKMQ